MTTIRGFPKRDEIHDICWNKETFQSIVDYIEKESEHILECAQNEQVSINGLVSQELRYFLTHSFKHLTLRPDQTSPYSLLVEALTSLVFGDGYVYNVDNVVVNYHLSNNGIVTNNHMHLYLREGDDILTRIENALRTAVSAGNITRHTTHYNHTTCTWQGLNVTVEIKHITYVSEQDMATLYRILGNI